jgi:hypothetical protein
VALYQLLAPILACYYIYRLFVELKNRRKFLFTSILWLGFWSIVAVLGIVPNEFSVKVAGWLGFASNINAVIFLALAFLVLLSFYLSSKLDNMERKMTELVRQLALDESKIRDLERRRIKENAEKKSTSSSSQKNS